jgi:putative RNA 2'-phosphotransferase
MEKELTKVSKYMSFLLRHKPDAIGLNLDDQGWASIDELIEKTTDFALNKDLIALVAETCEKQRFAIDFANGKIRANQGHSIDVDLNLEPITPPSTLVHGSAERFLESILEKGLTKHKRHHVHLSESSSVAMSVGGRYGKPVLLEIDAKTMYDNGHLFYRSVNNVWLVDSVPPEYIKRV